MKHALKGIGAIFSSLLLSCTTMEGRAESYINRLPEEQHLEEQITEADLQDLPQNVQRYFHFSQVLGKPKIASFSAVIEGRIRQSSESAWMSVVSRQYNYLPDPARIYYIEAQGMPVSGVDSYLSGEGRMQIKLLNLINVGNVAGVEMTRSALVTLLNDLVICPLGYFSLPVTWELVDEHRARISLENRGIQVSGIITFGKDGRPLNWESNDRYAEVKGRQLPDKWSTPFSSWGEMEGLMIPLSGEGIHNYDGNPYTYVKLDTLKHLTWNVRGLPRR